MEAAATLVKKKRKSYTREEKIRVVQFYHDVGFSYLLGKPQQNCIGRKHPWTNSFRCMTDDCRQNGVIHVVHSTITEKGITEPNAEPHTSAACFPQLY